MQLLNSSLTLQPDDEWVNGESNVFKCDKTSLQIEISELQDKCSKNLYNERYLKIEIEPTCEELCLKYVLENKLPTLKLLIVKMRSMFGYIYCESDFSKMNYIKNKYRS